MPSFMLGALNAFKQPCGDCTSNVPILQMRKWRFWGRETICLGRHS